MMTVYFSPTINTMTLIIAAFEAQGITISCDGLVRCINRDGKRWIETDHQKVHPIHQRIVLGVSTEAVDGGVFQGYIMAMQDYCESKPPRRLLPVARKAASLAEKMFGKEMTKIIVAGYNHGKDHNPTTPTMYHIDGFARITRPTRYATVGTDDVAQVILKERFDSFVLTPEGIAAESQRIMKASSMVQTRKTIGGQLYAWHLTREGISAPIKMEKIEVDEADVAEASLPDNR